MNKNGQIDLGVIIITFVALLVGVVLFQVVAQTVGESVNTVTLTDLDIGVQTNGTTTYLEYRALSSVAIINGTDLNEIGAGNYTITNNVINPTTGALSVGILPASEFTGETWILNATAQPTGYIAESGGRAMANLVVIFFALAILIVAIVPNLRNEFMNMIHN